MAQEEKTHRKKLPLGQLLKEQEIVAEPQIQFVLREQRATGERLGECLARLGLVTPAELAKALAGQSGLPFIDLSVTVPARDALSAVPMETAKRYQILPVSMEGSTLHLASSDPYDYSVADVIFRLTGLRPSIRIGAADQIERLIEWHYHLLEHPVDDELDGFISSLREHPGADVDTNRLIDDLLISAVNRRATDIHITPTDVSCRVMFRIDGVLTPAFVFPVSVHSRVVTNIKVRAEMDISEQRRPQDGRMAFEFLGTAFDIRVSSVRARFGENLVLRLLPSRGGNVLAIDDLGFEPDQLARLKELFVRPYGMALVTGPTGSGKTTTLYAALRCQDSIGKNILTVEDPIEYEFLMIRQTQVNEPAGYTFASAIRTFLRQDPDVILVGEIRDEETAVLAVRAALTGHLLLSTVHANTAVGAVARLRDLGISPFLLSNSLVGVIAQRLCRRLCLHCREPYTPAEKEIRGLSLDGDGPLYRAVGCDRCGGTGYLGRTVVGEVLAFTPDLLELLGRDASLGELEARAREEGFYDMKEAGLKKVARGEISLEEYRRVIG